MLKKEEKERTQVELLCLEQLVPEDHLVRKIDNVINFDFIYDEVKDLYSDIGRSSIDPVSLIKIALIQFMFGIKSMRQTIKELEVNMAYRWFCGFGITSQVPHFTTFGKNYTRRFQDNDIFEKIFNKILAQAVACGFVKTKAIFMDSTHIKASANKKKKVEYEIKNEVKNYQKTLLEEINEDRAKNGKKEIDDKDDNGSHKITKSTTDPDAGDFHKGEHEQMFAYSAHTVCDENGFVLDFTVTPANVHDSTEFSNLFNKVKNKFNFDYIALDAGYENPAIAKEIFDNEKLPLMPYKRPNGRKNTELKFTYDKYYDIFTCPNGNLLEYATTNRQGYREYTSNSEMCKLCPNYTNCISSSQNKKAVRRHIWQKYLDRVNDLRKTEIWKKYYPKRSETIERVFGDAKEKHGMRYTQLRGKKKVTLQVLLTFSCMNLKKLANWSWNNMKKALTNLLKTLKTHIFSNQHLQFA